MPEEQMTGEDQAGIAEQIITTLLPDEMERLFLVETLIDSISVANSISPNAWAVTLFSNGFRLNVGQVEVLVLTDDQLQVNLHGVNKTNVECAANLVEANYKSMPQPQSTFLGTVSKYSNCKQQLISYHREFLRLAALSPSGKPRKGTSFSRSHSEGLVSYARKYLDSHHSKSA